MGTRLRYLYRDYNCYFITTTFNEWIELLINDKYYKILDASIEFVCKKYKADIIAYVWMKNHIHFVVFFHEQNRLSDLMRDFKKYTGRQIRKMLQEDGRVNILDQLRHLDRTQIYKVWKNRYDAVVITNSKVLFTKIEYIHNNPIKKGYVNNSLEWKQSSASFYYGNNTANVRLINASEIL